MRAKWRSSLSACSSALEKGLTRADIVRDAMFRQVLGWLVCLETNPARLARFLNFGASSFVTSAQGVPPAMLRLFVFMFTVGISLGQSAQPRSGNAPLSADAIMTRVAVNQDQSEALRKQLVCRQHIHIVTRKSGGKMMREETTEYDVVPTETGTQKQLKLLTGRYWDNGKYEDFKGEPVPEADSWDADYIRDVRRCLAGEESRCKLGPQLFPLTSEEQKNYDFRLMGQEILRGRDAYRVGFVPKNKNAFAWTGEAFVDAADFQPVRVFTRLSRHVPFTERVMLGTNATGFGYDLEYGRQGDGAWFPISYGTEYELQLFFRIRRTVSVTMDTSFEPAGRTAAK